MGVIDGLVLSGGSDIDPLLFGQEPHQDMGSVDRVRDEMELQLTQKALAQDLPILAICRGIQMLNVAAGGTIYQDIAAEMPQPTLRHSQKGAGWYASHTIDILPDSRLLQIFWQSDHPCQFLPPPSGARCPRRFYCNRQSER